MISIVIPIYQNQDVLEELYTQLKEVLLKRPHEIIFVDDASPDRSRAILDILAARDPHTRMIALETNGGQHRAVLEGLKEAKGSVIVTMDGDLQDSPSTIPQLIEKLQEGYEAVFAGRKGEYESSFRLWTSKIFKGLLHRICHVPKDAGMFVAMSRKMVDAVLKIKMKAPFVVAMIGLTRLPTHSIPVLRQKRNQGKSAYTTWMRLKIGCDALLQTWNR
ncbi:MAG: putative glycosyltransferase [Chlamydiae bacterium]|nr:putative glycosyltransferase [Chlamydiota bacterium]